MGDPWLHEQSAFLGDRIVKVCPESPKLPAKPNADSHYERNVPISYGNACLFFFQIKKIHL